MFIRFFLNIFIILHVSGSNNSLEIINHPMDKYVQVNESVTLKCLIKDFDKEHDLVEWCKNDFCTWGRAIELSDGRLKFKSLSRLYIVGDRINGEWNLLIENITLRDVGEYKCTVTRRNDQISYKIHSNSANVKIMEKPSLIELNHQKDIEIVLDRSQDINLVVQKAVPDPKISWFMIDAKVYDEFNLNDKTSIKLKNKSNSSFKIDSFKTPDLIYTSKLSLLGSMDLLNKTLIAVVEHPLLKEPVIKSLKINLKYPPILSVTYEPREPLEEDKTYTFYCHSYSNDQISVSKNFYYSNVNYKFQNINGSIKLKLNRKMNGSLLICEDNNLIGKSILNYSLDILYAPRFIETPDPIVLVNKEIKKLSLNCSVDSNPKSEIYWIKDDDKIVHIGEQFNIDKDFDGEYECQARVKGFETVAYKVSVVTEGPPKINGQNLYLFETNKDLNIHFNVLSSPSYHSGPICYKVDRNSSSILNIIFPLRDKDRYFLEEDDLNDLKISTNFRLRIKNPNNDDIGFYNCTFSNSFGESFLSFEIKKKVESIGVGLVFSLVIIFSIIITILILSILILICIQRKRDRKNSDKKTLPNVSDHSGYEQNDKLNNQYQIFSCEKITVVNDLSKQLSDANLKYNFYQFKDRKIDNSFKKQSNQISLIMDQNSSESLSECLMSQLLC